MYQQQKKVTAIGTKGSKSKTRIMKSVQNIQQKIDEETADSNAMNVTSELEQALKTASLQWQHFPVS